MPFRIRPRCTPRAQNTRFGHAPAELDQSAIPSGIADVELMCGAELHPGGSERRGSQPSKTEAGDARMTVIMNAAEEGIVPRRPHAPVQIDLSGELRIDRRVSRPRVVSRILQPGEHIAHGR